MKQTLARWAEVIDARSLRERLLVFAAAALALVMMVSTLVLDPLTAKRKALLQTLQDHATRMEATRMQVQVLVRDRARDPDAELTARLAALKARSAELEERLAAFQQGLVSAERMADVLRDLLARHQAVRLIALKSLPATGIGADGRPVEAEAGGKAAAPLLYRQGVEITVEGTYADLLAYAESIEAAPWRLLWGGAKLSVVEYPRSRLTLILYTLSPDKPWLSV